MRWRGGLRRSTECAEKGKGAVVLLLGGQRGLDWKSPHSASRVGKVYRTRLPGLLGVQSLVGQERSVHVEMPPYHTEDCDKSGLPWVAVLFMAHDASPGLVSLRAGAD